MNDPIDNIKETYLSLITEIEKHNRLYYNQAAPIISDRDYDELMHRLIQIETEHPAIAIKNSPTNTIGSSIEEDTKNKLITHNPKMMSISNCYDEAGLQKFVKRSESLAQKKVAYMTELKIDGLAISIIYENGKLTRGATRGNGTTGEDVTDILEYVNLPKNLQLPKQDNQNSRGLFAQEPNTAIEIPARLEVRGEIYMPRKAFKEIVSLQEESGEDRVFANPRNAAAGALKTKILHKNELATKSATEIKKYYSKLQQIKKSQLSLWVYSTTTPEALGANSQEEALNALTKLGFPVNPERRLFTTLEEIIKRKDELNTLRHNLPYDTDGMVLKVNSFAEQEVLGVDAKSPNWAIAFKFEPEQAQTTVKNIRIQVGKFGTLTPVADLEPVFVSGSTVSHATLHNIDNIIEKDIRIGDEVLIEKAGEIIPQIAKSLHELRTGGEQIFIMPAHCPICGSEVGKYDNKVAYYCQNISCPAQLRARLLHFVSREAMDIEGFGPAIIDALIKRDKLHNVADIYKLSFDDLRELWEDTEKKKLTANIYKKTQELTEAELEQQPLEKLRSKWNKILINSGRQSYTPPEYKNAENILKAIERSKNIGLEKLLASLAIEQLGATAARIIATHFKNLDNLFKATVSEISNLSAGDTSSYRTLGIKSAQLLHATLQQENTKKIILQQGQTLAKKLDYIKLSGFGKVKRNAVAKIYANDPTALLNASAAELSSIELGTSEVKRTLGDVVAQSLKCFLKTPRNKELLTQLQNTGVKTEINSNSNIDNALTGKTFVLTGTLENMSRSEAKKIIESAGGIVGSAISRNTDFLIAGANAGSKLTKAENLGIQVLNKEALLALCTVKQ